MAATALGRGDIDEMDEAGREALRTLLLRLADDELVVGERYTEWQVYAPTLESDLALSNVAQDEFGHARLWYDLVEDFGYEEADLIWERDPADFVHASFVERPTGEGDWADTILRGYLYDEAEHLGLESVADSAYAPLADRVEKVVSEERYHREHAQRWLERLTDDEPGRERVQAALDRLFPWALTLFEPTDEATEAAIDEHGFRTASLDEMREQWLDTVVPYLDSLGLTVPEPDSVERPEATGRNGEHTDDWFELFDDMTRTYRELDRSSVTRLMEKPE